LVAQYGRWGYHDGTGQLKFLRENIARWVVVSVVSLGYCGHFVNVPGVFLKKKISGPFQVMFNPPLLFGANDSDLAR